MLIFAIVQNAHHVQRKIVLTKKLCNKGQGHNGVSCLLKKDTVCTQTDTTAQNRDNTAKRENTAKQFLTTRKKDFAKSKVPCKLRTKPCPSKIYPNKSNFEVLF